MSKCFIVRKGKVLSKECLEKSFVNLKIVDGEKFCLMCPNTKKEFNMVKWVRFKRIVSNDYSVLPYRDNEWAAIIFVPKVDVFFMGFGVIGNYD